VPLRLIMQPGGLCLELTQPSLLLGRLSTADIRLTLPDISRRHCRFLFTDGQWEVVDLNSLNGIYVNGHRLREAVLGPGDKVQVGSLLFIVEMPAQLRPVRDPEDPADLLQSIVKILPGPGADGTQEYRKAG
jgi:pSer/pThr/pTyr-binding forkhead associated (FHA) protein